MPWVQVLLCLLQIVFFSAWPRQWQRQWQWQWQRLISLVEKVPDPAHELLVRGEI
jgi:hypothetical protein